MTNSDKDSVTPRLILFLIVILILTRQSRNQEGL